MTSEVEQGPDDHDDDRDDAGDDEVAALQVLVEPDPDAALDGRPDPLPALAVQEVASRLRSFAWR